MSVYITLKGGLGNQMFQLAMGHSISRNTDHKLSIKIDSVQCNKHSNINYMNNLFVNWKNDYALNTVGECTYINENDNLYPLNINDIYRIPNNINIMLNGYFQNYNYIDHSFISSLNWNNDVLTKYSEIDNSAFIHFRGGDYLQKGHKEFHYIDMNNYYKKCLERMKNDVKHYYAFTNDINHMTSHSIFDDIRFTPVDENEIDSLYIMSQCAKGGIAVNSSFGWWGLYLNKFRSHLYLPDKWYNDKNIYTDGYYFKEATVISTD
jgi:hypothetical protein